MWTEWNDDAKFEVLKVIEGLLPNAKVDDVTAEISCGCYSEWTTEPCSLWIRFEAPRPPNESERDLSKLVSLVEKVVKGWALQSFEWRGCVYCGKYQILYIGWGDQSWETQNDTTKV